MTISLYHHPDSRTANVVWMLEEVGVPYELRFVDIQVGEQKSPELVALNPMGKLPVLTDVGQVVTESAAIGRYLADRYAIGRLAPQLDDPRRGTYLRWALFAPSVIEPGVMAKQANWDCEPSRAGWGTYEAMLEAMESATIRYGFILGEQFSMADVIFGGTVRYMLTFKLIEVRPSLVRRELTADLTKPLNRLSALHVLSSGFLFPEFRPSGQQATLASNRGYARGSLRLWRWPKADAAAIHVLVRVTPRGDPNVWLH